MSIKKINKKSIIFPELVPFVIPDFEKHNQEIVPKVLSFTNKSSQEWFNEFVTAVESKIGKEFYPIVRMSDGEYQFLLGDVPPIYHSDIVSFAKSSFMHFLRRLKKTKDFKAATLPGVSSGTYTKDEISDVMRQYGKWMKSLSEKGVIALHLTYSKKSFQDKFHYHLKRWFTNNNIVINKDNYYPFYFVYALLRGESRKRIFKNNRVLVIHSAEDDKREKIKKSLQNEGVSKVDWLKISSSRSLFDQIDVNKYVGQVDLVLLGAGVGKPNIMVQLEKLKVPCIDAGFVFEVWAEDENKWKRPFMVKDSDWDLDKIKFL
uniref:hypothetical protein n=1 Tax=uncultured Polaribacter sp. TaxID=174711 RepID=UPI0026363A96|nr:hypothetical protein [uncultured Polaribacter sp.]